jgi:superfamily II DNA or RNA helicase
MSTSTKDRLREEIARAEALLATLESERESARARLKTLRDQLTESRTEVTRATEASSILYAHAPTAPEEKVRLFRRLFRGREDVFPKLWLNPKTGKKGYAPACSNEWVRGICEKPRIRCGECPNQAFIPVGDQVVLDHLRGRHVIGTYPLLKDETCCLLVVDFDKGSWAEDVLAFTETCRRLQVPAAMERSRSGNGAHVWFFFRSPVPASDARRMGCHLITETMTRRHQLSMSSYDRLFPNQDTMPRGGFGNLIALPLQHGPRQRGYTVFLDDHLTPYADQWAFLASLQKIEPATVEDIAREAIRLGQVVGVREVELTDDGDATAPWNRRPSKPVARWRATEPLPQTVRAVLAQRLFVDKVGLPSSLLSQFKRLAAFQNPEFYKKQSLRLSTALTPRVIACAEEFPQHIALPRGCGSELKDLISEHGAALDVEDQRQAGKALNLRFAGELTSVQREAVSALLQHETGIFVAPPGVGKTVVAIRLIAERACNTLVLVHRRPLLDQWLAQISLFLGLDGKDIGQVGGGQHRPTEHIDVAMIQSLVRHGQVDDIVANYGHVIVDECHHIPAFSFEKVLSETKARYLVGLTATPQRRDGHHPIIEMQLGPVRFSIGARSEAARRPFEQHLVVRETAFRARSARPDLSIQELYDELVADKARNDLILNDVIRSLEEGRSPILLTERTVHLDYFVERLQNFTRHLVVLRGGRTAKARRQVASQLADIPDDEERLVLATGRYIGEGFDDARLDTLFLALPVSWKGTLLQYAGRLHRLHPRKSEVRIFDYVDTEVPMLRRMFEKRLKGYRAIGYARDEAPLGYEEPKEDPVVVWDEDAVLEFDEPA